MTKINFISKILECIKLIANDIYLSHLKSIVSRCGLKEENSHKIKTIIEDIILINKRHRDVLRELADRIRRENRDVL